jgi:hypothetical protein
MFLAAMVDQVCLFMVVGAVDGAAGCNIWGGWVGAVVAIVGGMHVVA